MGFIYRLGHINRINMKFGVKSLGQGHVYWPKKILWHKRAHRIFYQYRMFSYFLSSSLTSSKSASTTSSSGADGPACS